MSATEVKLEILNCERCELHERATPVPFFGDSPNPFVVIGEAPGESEDSEGRPFVGPAGQLLRRAINISFGEPGFDETFTYVNVVSCYPGKGGTPRRDHLVSCAQNLERQLEVIEPRYGILVGGVALNALWPKLGGSLSISQYRGAWLELRMGWGKLFLRATWHPSAVMRDGGLGGRKGKEFMEDLSEYAEVILKYRTPADAELLASPLP